MKTVKDGIIRHYWKNNYSPNGTVVGTLTNNDCVISGFSDSNYLLVDKYPTNITSLEMYFKIKVESLGFRTIVGQKANNYKTPQLGISGSSPHYFYWNISKNGSSWVSLETNYVPNLNQYYWVKGTWNGSQIELFISEDGETFTSLGTKACTSCTWTEGIKVGDDADTSDWFDGSIDLNESYIDVNNERWWDGTYISSRTEVTSSDPYDYTTTENIYKAVKQVERKYWKREETEQSWTQPVLNANGTIGGDSFACAASSAYNSSYAWKAFDNDLSTDWGSNGTVPLPAYLEWYNPKPLKINKIVYRTGNASGGRIIEYKIQASIDGNNWIDIYNGNNPDSTGNIEVTVNITNSSSYSYWRIYALQGNGGISIANIQEVIITATQLEETIVSGTAEDYDFYTDETNYKGVNL